LGLLPATLLAACGGADSMKRYYILPNNEPTGATFTPPTLQQLRDIGYLIVTDAPYSADSSGVADATTAIQSCIDDGETLGKPVWFPYGTYTISSPLHCYHWELWSGGASTANTLVHNLQGEYRANGTRPLIKLHATAAVFDSVGTPAPMLGFRCYEALTSGGTSPPGSPPVNPMTVPANWGANDPDLFSCSLRGIDFDTNGHVGAVGVTFPGAQWCFMERVKVTSTSSYASFGALPTTGSAVVNIEGVGGQYGIFNTSSTQGYNGTGYSIIGLRLSNHTVQSIVNNNFVTHTIIGFDISPAAGGIVWKTPGTLSNTGYGMLCAIDGRVSQASGTVFDQSSSGKSMYLRNIYVTGTNTLIKMNASTTTSSGTWKLINEYSSCDQRGAPGAPYANPSTTYFTYNVIGTQTQTEEVINNITASSGSPPADLLTKHYPDPFDMVDTGAYANIVDYGAVPVSGVDVQNQLDNKYFLAATGQTDNLGPINNAISAASAAGHNRVLIPWGTYLVSNTLTLGDNTKLFGIGQRHSNLGPFESWRPTTGSPYIIDTYANTEGSAFLGNLSIAIPQVSGTLTAKVYSGNRFSHVKWRSGRRSITSTIRHQQQFVTVATSDTAAADKFFVDITNTGGGRHFGICSGGHSDLLTTASRMVRITGTTQASAFYGINPELGKNVPAASMAIACVEVKDSSNVRFTVMKREGAAGTLLIDNSSNVALYGSGAMVGDVSATPAYYIRVLSTSSNVLVACVAPQQYTTQSTPTFYDQAAAITITMPEALAIYKTGSLNDTLMSFV
jgi:hypothetical protein